MSPPLQPAGFDVVTVTLNPAIDQTLIVPNFTKAAVNRATEVRSNAGGKGVNVAVVLADRGLRVAATGLLGSGNSGPFETLFAEKRIEDRFVRIPGTTRTGIKLVDPTRQQTTDINTPGASVGTADTEALYAMLSGLRAPWFVLAGSLPPGTDAGLWRDLANELKARGAAVAVDTSGEALEAAIAAAPTVVKPNLYELEALTGRTLSGEQVVEAARDLTKRGVELAIVSMGAEGAWFVTREESVFAVPPHVAVKSTVGAGDAMVAGTVAARLAGLSLPDTARLATAFALDALGRIGAGLSAPEMIAALAERVSISKGS